MSDAEPRRRHQEAPPPQGRAGPDPGAAPRRGQDPVLRRGRRPAGQVQLERGRGRVHAGLVEQVRRRNDQAGAVRQGGVHQAPPRARSAPGSRRKAFARAPLPRHAPCLPPSLAQMHPDRPNLPASGAHFSVCARTGKPRPPPPSWPETARLNGRARRPEGGETCTIPGLHGGLARIGAAQFRTRRTAMQCARMLRLGMR